jgi:hypothetical protein
MSGTTGISVFGCQRAIRHRQSKHVVNWKVMQGPWKHLNEEQINPAPEVSKKSRA